MSIEAEKSALRKILKEKRAMLNNAEIVKKSQAINQNFIKNLLPKIYQKNSRQNFALYLQSGNEVGTGMLANYFEQNSIPFSYPRISARGKELEFVLVQGEQTFEQNQFYPSIFEPVSGKKILPDFLIVPLLAFDRDLARLGMGGGFYDRTIDSFMRQNHKIITIGFAYDFQGLREFLPTEKCDRKLNFIVTEKNIFAGRLVP